MIRTEIFPDVYLNSIEAEKFNRSRISISFTMPSNKETATAMALLPMIMSRGYTKYPTMKILSTKLAKLYGAGLTADCMVMGENRILVFSIVGIKDKFALNNENLTKEYMDIILGSIFEPTLIDGVFDNSILEIEKEKLKEILLSEINDKRGYCLKQARRKFFGENLAGIEKYGYLDKVDEVTTQQLYDLYLNILSTSKIEIMALGTNKDVVIQEFEKYHSKINRQKVVLNTTKIMPMIDVQEFNEKVETAQGKLAMIFTINEKLKPEDLSKMRLAIAVFGGLPTSRLFTNVREKLSLCYYCAAGYTDITGMLVVDSGIEHSNSDKTKKAILHELEILKVNDITDDELNNSKKSLITSLKSIPDSLGGLENWYLSEISRNTNYSPKEVMEQIKLVTKEDIKNMLNKFSLSVVYTLTNN